MRYLIAIIIMFSGLCMKAQGPVADLPVVQVSGVVVVGDSLYPAPYVSIYRLRDYRGTYSDHTGYFTLPALEGDTLVFHYFGLKRSAFVVPRQSDVHISIVQIMEEDTIQLKTTYILPYPSRENLRKEVLALGDVGNDKLFHYNASSVNLKNRDGMYDFKDEASRNSQKQDANRNNPGALQTGGNILDFKAWSRFLKSRSR